MDAFLMFGFNRKATVVTGCATGTTRGIIETHSNPFFFVNCSEIGEFAIRGDSGSLVISVDSNLVLGVVSRFESDKKWIKCIKIQYLMEIPNLRSTLQEDAILISSVAAPTFSTATASSNVLSIPGGTTVPPTCFGGVTASSISTPTTVVPVSATTESASSQSKI